MMQKDKIESMKEKLSNIGNLYVLVLAESNFIRSELKMDRKK